MAKPYLTLQHLLWLREVVAANDDDKPTVPAGAAIFKVTA